MGSTLAGAPHLGRLWSLYEVGPRWGWKLLGRALRANVHLQIQATSAFSLCESSHLPPWTILSKGRAKANVKEVPEEKRSGLCAQKGPDGLQAQQVPGYVVAISPADWNLASGYVIVRISSWD